MRACMSCASVYYVSMHECADALCVRTHLSVLFCLSVCANVWFVCVYLGGGGGWSEFCVMHVHMYKFQVLLPGTTYLIKYYGLSEL